MSALIERLRKGAVAYVSESGPVYAGPTSLEREAAEALAIVEIPAVAQLGGAPDDLHNLIRVTFADMSIERINEVCKQVLAMRAAAEVHP